MATGDPWDGLLPAYEGAWVSCSHPDCTATFERLVRVDSAPDVLTYIGRVAEQHDWQVDWENPPDRSQDRCPAHHLVPSQAPRTLAQVRADRRATGGAL